MNLADSLATMGGSEGGSGAPAFSGVVAPDPTSESVAAGGSLSPKTFGAFTDPNGLIDPSNYNAVTTNADGSASWSGSGLGAYTPTDTDGDSGTLALQARDADDNVLATAYHSYARGAATVAAEWADTTNYTYSSDNDITVTITEGGGDTQLYEADGTTEKGLVRLVNRGGSPITTATVDADGITAQSVRTGANQSAYLAWVMSDSDLDFTEHEKYQAVDIVIKDLAFLGDDDQTNIYLGDDPSPVSGNGLMIQIRKVSGATEYRLRRLSSSSFTDTSFTSGFGSITSIAVRWLFYYGNPFVMLFQPNATAPIAATKGNGSTIFECWRGGSIASLNDANPELITTPWYVGFDLGPRANPGQVDGTVTHVVCSELDTTP